MANDQTEIYIEDGPLADRVVKINAGTRWLVLPDYDRGPPFGEIRYGATGRLKGGNPVWSSNPQRLAN